MADFSPYYEAGVKFSYQVTPQWFFAFHVLNGWQNISENNSNKAVGTQLSFSPSESIALSYNTFYGEEIGALWRFFNDFFAKISLTDRLQVAPLFDIGFQRQPGGSGASTWYGVGLVGRYQLTSQLAVAARVERYSDPDRVIVQPTDPTKSFVATSASLNVDYELYRGFLWRNEVRGYWAQDAVFPQGAGFSTQDALVTTSLSLSF